MNESISISISIIVLLIIIILLIIYFVNKPEKFDIITFNDDKLLKVTDNDFYKLIIDTLYPIGSIYIGTSNQIFPVGNWEKYSENATKPNDAIMWKRNS